MKDFSEDVYDSSKDSLNERSESKVETTLDEWAAALVGNVDMTNLYNELD